MAKVYQPINCDFYDHLEAAATLHKQVEIQYYDQGNSLDSVSGRIIDLFIREGAEWLKLKEGKEIRLDWLTAVDGEQVPTHC